MILLWWSVSIKPKRSLCCLAHILPHAGSLRGESDFQKVAQGWWTQNQGRSVISEFQGLLRWLQPSLQLGIPARPHSTEHFPVQAGVGMGVLSRLLWDFSLVCCPAVSVELVANIAKCRLFTAPMFEESLQIYVLKQSMPQRREIMYDSKNMKYSEWENS